ncbi:3-hydroxyacyl-CoA dehydrogenase NAD-binding domain-containing protein [Salinisphaera hydrothermalis]|uniref:L-carnitine dehydrogenase n=1 Tax=Salinisphaera hydrothermalis (strain C41B8) TaxID=1304275 RepID=A0A084IHA2_SALHC|nr:3-hydroxyacyl-CoA dehydrogenase NAD-binding domain-containing protein [Salinisphaera hydrothermalis]KEZ76086.1 NAD-binding 3-hydroxyacyl-CoA dehydrogenase [Salinisphaera hydrothermalis C41B8]
MSASIEKNVTVPRRVAIVGTGVIGCGWAVRALAAGAEVVAYDTDIETARRRLADTIDIAWPSMEKRGLAARADRQNWRVTDDLDDAVAHADLVQENVPEQLELKQEVLSNIDGATPPDTLIGSSTSGIKPTDLAAGCGHAPERIFVAHPFNPVYLLPLVELVGGDATTPETLDAAQAVYRGLGMRPLVVRREIEGHIADRLMEALWREALHLVNDGVATTEEIDAAVVYGAGLRWSLMGTFLTFHLAGGEQGMRHMLEQFGPALKLPWTKLEAPELTNTLIERVVAGCEHQAAGRSIAELEHRRDAFLTDLLALVEQYWPESERLPGRI